jgi:hypothetical protein
MKPAIFVITHMAEIQTAAQYGLATGVALTTAGATKILKVKHAKRK